MRQSEIAISVEGVRTQFGDIVIHDDLDLAVRHGEVLAIVGGSGTGKSVLMREIVGLLQPKAGTIRVLGQNQAEIPQEARRELGARLGMLFQDGALFSSMTVLQNIQVPIRERYKLGERLLCELAMIKLSLAGLPIEAASKFPSELSGGMRKRAGLARALALDPEIVFLDEPTAGLDPIGAAAFDDLIRSLQHSLNLTVVMVTHDLDSLIRISDRVAVLLDKKATVGTLNEVRQLEHPWIQDYFRGPRGRAAAMSAGIERSA